MNYLALVKQGEGSPQALKKAVSLTNAVAVVNSAKSTPGDEKSAEDTLSKNNCNDNKFSDPLEAHQFEGFEEMDMDSLVKMYLENKVEKEDDPMEGPSPKNSSWAEDSDQTPFNAYTKECEAVKSVIVARKDLDTTNPSANPKLE